ncbi:MAG: hypothetical protein ACLPVI_07335 [Dehalococcoidales bacterium]
MLEEIDAILQSCDSESPLVPPTMLFNEGWCLRIILNRFSKNEMKGHPLSFEFNSTWYSEGLLRSPFLPRYRGDKLSESWTHADGVVGNFTISNTSEINLLPEAKRFVVLEAKIYSKLSQGVSHAGYFDQAARYIACIAELIQYSKNRPQNMQHLAFHILAPEAQIKADVFTNNLSRESIYKKVKKRVSEYGGEKESWFEEWFVPTLDTIIISAISWEEILESIKKVDQAFADKVKNFYKKCLKYNQLNKVDAEQVSAHDGTSGLIDTLQKKTKGKSVDVRLDM